jgi:hypothetical protein
VIAASLVTLTTTARAPSSASRADATAAEQRLGEAKRADDVGRERQLDVLAVGVGEQRERGRAEARRVVDQDVEAAERAADLQRDRVRVFLPGDVADDAVAAAKRFGDAAHARRVAGDEGDRSPRATKASTSARPRPEVPPVTATRSGRVGMGSES